MEENVLAYRVLTIGMILAFILFVLSLIFKEMGLGEWPLFLGTLILALTPLSTIFALGSNYMIKREYRWAAFCIIILIAVLISGMTTYFIGW